MGCLCGLDDQAVQDLVIAIGIIQQLPHKSDSMGEFKSRLEILREKLLQVEVNDGN